MSTNYKMFNSVKRLLAVAIVALIGLSAFGQTASFTVSDNTLFLCGGTTAQVQFTNTSTGLPNGGSYYWSFGNNTPGSTQTNPTQVYTWAGNFTVKLSMIGSAGDTLSQSTASISVQTPVASFTVSQNSGCAEQTTFQFTNQPVNGDHFVWNFGDGTTLSDVNNPSRVYTTANPSTNVSLLVYVNGFSNACASQVQQINVQPVPQALPAANNTTICDPNEAILFSNSSVNAVAHFWDFGDGQTATQASPSHVYGAMGTYNVSYIATGLGGCTDTNSLVITITNSIIPQITTSIDTSCSPMQVTFNCTNINSALQYVWDFGDGSNPVTTNVPTVNYTYLNGTSAPVSYNVSLTAVFGNSSSCNSSVTMNNFVTVLPQPLVTFNISSNSVCVFSPINFTNTTPNAVSYLWNFGNNQTSTLPNPSTSYTAAGSYNISLTITNSYGCTSTATSSNAITVNTVTANFNAVNTSGCTVNAQFLNYSSGATQYIWDFGDGSPTSSQVAPTHYYNVPGSYDVTLIASNSTCSDTIVLQDFINVNYVSPTYTPPNIPFSGCVGIASTFSANNPNGLNFIWDFGDGNNGSGPNPTHVYDAPGTYTVSLITMTADSCQELISNFAQITVYGGEPDVTTQNTSCAPPYTVNFSTPAAGSSYYWTFGDGTTSTQQNPSHVYTTDGYYNVSLTVTTPSGCSNTYNGFNQLALFPFQAGINAECHLAPPGNNPNLIETILSPIPADVASVIWTSSNGYTSNLINSSMVFDTSNGNGNVSITAIITNQFGCVDTVTASICEDSPPAIPQPAGLEEAPDTANPDPAFLITACAPYQLTFSNQFGLADSVIWHFGDGATSTLLTPTHEYGSSGTYTVYTEVWSNNYNTYDTIYQPYVYQIGGHIPSIAISQENFCDSIVVLFQGSSPDAVAWLWTLGNGDTETAQSFYYTYASGQQTYHVQLTTVDSQGCPGMATSSVYSPIYAPDFSYQTTLCNEPLNIAHNMDSSFTYLWDFGDSTTSTDMYPVHAYAAPGTYNVTLHITDALGCPHDYSLNPVTLYAPTPNFTATTYEGCGPLTVTYTSISTGYTAGNTHYWFFGTEAVYINDGSQPITYTFNNPGTYAVKLLVFNTPGGNGCFGTFIDTIRVYQAAANFGFTQDKACFQPDIDVQYIDSSANAVSWQWSFGDGTTSTLQNPQHTFTMSPTTDVSLVITDIHGCVDSISKPNINLFEANYTLTNNSVCGFTPINFDLTANSGQFTTVWDFGDNSAPETGNSVSHVYGIDGNYTATAIVTSADGCVDTVSNPVTIVQPVAEFFSTSPQACAPSNVTFHNISNAPPGSTYIWDFGDGTIITNNNPMVTQTYLSPGVYSVKLHIETPQGCTGDTTLFDYVTVLGPQANMIVSNTTGCENLPISFINLSSNVSSWVWYFGDGNIDSTNFSVDHAFTMAGTYQSTLVVYDSIGCAQSMTVPQPIVINPMPDAAMVIDYPSGCAPYLPQYYNNSVGGTTYTWVFGDGGFSNDSIPSYTYINPGVYTASLIVGNGTGCQDTAVTYVTVNPPPVAEFSVAIVDSTCEGITIAFNNTSQVDTTGADYKWAIDNGFNYNGFEPPNMTIDSSGTYLISLSVFNTYTGCYDTTSHSIIINVPGKPIGVLTTNDTLACGQITANFNMQAQGFDSMEVHYGDATVSTTFNPQYTYTQPGTYQPYIILTNAFGCVDTVWGPSITVAPVPVAAFSVDTTFGCSGITVNFTNGSTTFNNTTYSWDFGTGQTSTLDSPQGVAFDNPGQYTVTLIATGEYGCADTLTMNNLITIADTIAPPIVAMRRVTVVSETTVKIEWEPSTVFDFEKYIVYRFDGTSYQPLTIITDVNQTSYVDNMGLATLGNVYCYKVGVYDQCGYTRGIDSVQEHCTMDVKVSLMTNNDRLLKWNAYNGCSVDYYEIYRTMANAWNDTTAANLIGTVAGNVTGYVDSEVLCPRPYSYRIKAVSLCGGTLYSMSDTATAPMPKIDFTTLPANVTRSTVIDDQFTRSEWKAPYAPQLISYYTVFRSADSTSFQSVGQVNGPFSAADTLLQYDDWNASVQTTKYYYRIQTTSQCNDKATTGQTGDNIVLKAQLIPEQFEVELDWTPYVSWGTNGVDYYIIEWQDESGIWHQLDLPPNQYPNNQIPGNTTSYTAPY